MRKHSIKYSKKYSINHCEMLMTKIEELNTINILIYRPPTTNEETFNKIIKEIMEIYNKFDKPDPTIIISVDFNYPFVDWKKQYKDAVHGHISPIQIHIQVIKPNLKI